MTRSTRDVVQLTVKTLGEWAHYAACRGAPLDMFITRCEGVDEVEYPPKETRRICEGCLVRVECLAWAATHNEWGIWGGTTRYQRSQLRRVMSRRTCPACAKRHVTRVNQYEVCLSCGVSWMRSKNSR